VSSVVEGNLLTENTALRERLGRLSPVIPAMAADLASTRRDANRLRRENARLLAPVGSSAAELTPPLGLMLCDHSGSALLADQAVGAR
jgi:hypothetical protein